MAGAGLLSLALAAVLSRLPARRAAPARWALLAAADAPDSGSTGRRDPAIVLANWRQFRARMVQAESDTKVDVVEACGPNLLRLFQDAPHLAQQPLWAHLLPRPERGGLLVARAEAALEELLWQSVILVLEYSPGAAATGLVLNRPSKLTVRQLLRARSPYDPLTVYLGGPEGNDLTALHSVPYVPSHKKVMVDVYYGEMGPLIASKGPRFPVEGVKVFAGRVRWAPGELDGQMEAGLWWPVAASLPLLLKPTLDLPRPLWQEVLALCGGEPAAEASRYGDQQGAL
eukprot:EG_transcript_15229